jgi:hypothetical protein
MSTIRMNGMEITMEDLNKDEIIYRNFSGAGSDYNAEGKRNFNVVFRDPDTVKQLTKLGFRIKPKKNEDNAWTLKIHVNFSSKFPPDVYYILGNKTVTIDEENAYLLDKKIPLSVDLRFNGYKSKKSRDNFVDAYLDVLYFQAQKDYLAEKYSNLEEEDAPWENE